jgi:hypothetical protein
MGAILQKNLEVQQIFFMNYPEQQLFYRSDNATLARLGFQCIPFLHQGREPNYHKASDRNARYGQYDRNYLSQLVLQAS